jgi:hypothetical protein
MKNKKIIKSLFTSIILGLILFSCSLEVSSTNDTIDKKETTKTDVKDIAASKFISYNDENIKYNGRINMDSGDKAILYWSGSSIKISFIGTEIKALLKNEKRENYYNIIVDDSLYILEPSITKQWYTLASGLSSTKHTVEIFRRGEWESCGKTYFYGFEVPGQTEILPPEPTDMVIEFYGNSITAGRAVEDTVGDSPEGQFTNNYLSYSVITARHFNADYYCIARSGIGITISWFDMIMDEMYYRLDPNDPNSYWDFSQVQPDIVVINLFQNDSWLVNMPDNEQFKKVFGTEKPSDEFLIDAYKKFLLKIRKVYPNTPIICTLGSMDATQEGSPWPGYISSAVNLLDNSNLFTCFFPYQGKDGHPKVEDHINMANILIKFIEDNIKTTGIREPF